MVKIESHKRFVQEFEALQSKIDKSILELADYQRQEQKKPSTSLTEKINRLKLQRKHLEDMLGTYHDVNDDVWFAIKPKAQAVFDEAENEWMTPSEDLENA